MSTATAEAGRTLVETGTPGWYEDKDNPGKKTRKKEGDTVVSPTKERAANAAKANHERKAETKALPTGKLTSHPTVEITCEDCGKKRQVQVQDKHQVTRCIQHQKEHRNKRRREKRAEKKKAQKG